MGALLCEVQNDVPIYFKYCKMRRVEVSNEVCFTKTKVLLAAAI